RDPGFGHLCACRRMRCSSDRVATASPGLRQCRGTWLGRKAARRSCDARPRACTGAAETAVEMSFSVVNACVGTRPTPEGSPLAFEHQPGHQIVIPAQHRRQAGAVVDVRVVLEESALSTNAVAKRMQASPRLALR